MDNSVRRGADKLSGGSGINVPRIRLSCIQTMPVGGGWVAAVESTHHIVRLHIKHNEAIAIYGLPVGAEGAGHRQ